MAEFKFGEVDAVLAALNNIAPHKRVAFTGRLKFLLKNGLPTQNRPGRGRAVSYSFGELMQLAIAVDLMQAGMDQKVAASMVRHNWSSMRPTVYLGTFTAAELAGSETNKGFERPAELVFLIHLEALRDLTPEGVGEYDHFEAVTPTRISDISRELSLAGGFETARPRSLIIYGGSLTEAAVLQIVFRFKFTSVEDLRADLARELEETQKAFEDMRTAVQSGELKISDPIERAKLARILARHQLTDFSTNPPSPPEVLEKRAYEMIPRLSMAAKGILLSAARSWKGSGLSLVISDDNREALKELADYEVFTVDGGESLVITAFGLAAMRVAGRVENGGHDVNPKA